MFKKLLVTLALMAGMSIAHAQAAPVTVTLNTSVASGTAPLAVTVTWSSTNTVGATPCTASGLWTGAKAASGSQVVTVSASGQINLSCNGAVETAQVSWTAPTQNTDGSPLTDLANYKIYTSKDNISFVVSATIPAPATSFSLAGLAAGPTYFKMTALNASGVESAYSATAQKTLATMSASASKAITINTIPNPPSGVTVIAIQAYNIKNGKPETFVGVVPLGTACDAYLGKKWGVDWYTVGGDKVTPQTLAPVAVNCG